MVIMIKIESLAGLELELSGKILRFYGRAGWLTVEYAAGAVGGGSGWAGGSGACMEE